MNQLLVSWAKRVQPFRNEISVYEAYFQQGVENHGVLNP